MMKYTVWQSPLGPLTLAASERGLSGVYFAEHKHFSGVADWQPDAGQPYLQQAIQQLHEYFHGGRRAFDLPLDLSAGTAFQQAVWRALQAIPYGQTCSYRDLAVHLNNPAAVRAVGAANGKNPVSIIIPCHRVIAVSGALTGYAGGLENKQRLLRFEAEKEPVFA